MNSRNAIKARIGKLLNLAESGSGAAQGEIENALRFAESLMHRHNLDRAECEDRGIKTGDTPIGRAGFWFGTSRDSKWETALAWLVCSAVGTVQWYGHGVSVRRTDHGTLADHDDTKRYRSCYLYGPRDDCETARSMFDDLRLTIAAMARLKWGGCYRGSGRSYAEGFVDGLENQMNERRSRRPASENAIVLRSTELIKSDARAWLEREYGATIRTTPYRGCTRDDQCAWSGGHADGREHTIGARRGTRLAGERVAALPGRTEGGRDDA